MYKHIIALVTLLLLSACAVKYDGTIYGKLVDVAVATVTPSQVCALPPKDFTTTIESISSSATYADIYASGFQGNGDISKILAALTDDIDRFKFLQKKSTISSTYCMDKISNIHKLAMTALQAAGSTR